LNPQFELVASADAGVHRCRGFEPVTDCPRCGVVAEHPVTPADDQFVSRECACGMSWRQFK